MTKEEAIKMLKSKMDGHTDTSYEWAETVRMAIKALEQQEQDDAIKYFEAIYKVSQTYGMPYSFVKDKIDQAAKALKALEQELCEDCISRQEVLDALDKSKYSNAFCEEHHIDWSINLGMAHIVVNELKPVTPQPKMGRWVKTIGENGVTSALRCSECGFEDNRYELFNYCPVCGMKM